MLNLQSEKLDEGRVLCVRQPIDCARERKITSHVKRRRPNQALNPKPQTLNPEP